MAKHGKEKGKKNSLKKIMFLFFLGIFLFSSMNLIKWYIDNERLNYLMKEIVTEKDEATTEDSNVINFENLKQRNPDVVGWIKIDNTSVNYPILQSNDNEFYLQKDFDKKNNRCGWIFMDYRNSNQFMDKNTVIYGHNLKRGYMFADLIKILNGEIGDVPIEIYSQNKKMEYKIFSSYMTKPDKYAINATITEEDEQQKYIVEMLNRSKTVYNVVPDKSDQLLTLSTCDGSGKNRVLVHAVKVKEEKVGEK